MISSSLMLSCHHCGAAYQRPVLEAGQWAQCERCDHVLETYSVFTPRAWLAVIVATLLCFALANVYPIATLLISGQSQAASFFDAIVITWQAGYPEVAVVTFAAGFLLPFVQLLLLLWVFSALSLGRLPVFFDELITLIDVLKPWCMVPVFLMGVLVSVVKLVGLASLVPGVGLFATAISALFVTALTRLSAQKIRCLAHDIGLPAPFEPLPKAPSPTSFQRTWALLLAAVLLYIPANLLPIMQINSIAGNSAHTILGGVLELVSMGSYSIAAVVFIASVVVPLFKLVCLAVLVYLAQLRATGALRTRTHLYEMVEFIGQWSMLDVFVVILLSALGRFGNLLTIEPGGGAVAFAGVVIVTMLAALGFDPRLAWRRAGHRRHLVPQPTNIPT
jgi:paraquat-inducible protein A